VHGSKAVIIYGFESAAWPLTPAIAAFEALSRSMYSLGPRMECSFSGLIHPVHKAGAVYGWELHTARSKP
jgi:hypothetical protein